MPPVGFEPPISAGERPKTYALDRAATRTGGVWFITGVKSRSVPSNQFLCKQQNVYFLLCQITVIESWTAESVYGNAATVMYCRMMLYNESAQSLARGQQFTRDTVLCFPWRHLKWDYVLWRTRGRTVKQVWQHMNFLFTETYGKLLIHFVNNIGTVRIK